MAFEYDVYGRLKRAYQLNTVDIQYGYDEMSRIVWRKVNEESLQRFFYAYPHQPRRISHFTSEWVLHRNTDFFVCSRTENSCGRTTVEKLVQVVENPRIKLCFLNCFPHADLIWSNL